MNSIIVVKVISKRASVNITPARRRRRGKERIPVIANKPMKLKMREATITITKVILELSKPDCNKAWFLRFSMVELSLL